MNPETEEAIVEIRQGIERERQHSPPPTPASLLSVIGGVLAILTAMGGLFVYFSARDVAQAVINKGFQDGLEQVQRQRGEDKTAQEKRDDLIFAELKEHGRVMQKIDVELSGAAQEANPRKR